MLEALACCCIQASEWSTPVPCALLYVRYHLRHAATFHQHVSMHQPFSALALTLELIPCTANKAHQTLVQGPEGNIDDSNSQSLPTPRELSNS